MVSNPYIGKVRKVSDIGYGRLLLSASDRLSSFDKHICDIKGKGYVLNKMSEWWFKNTTHIIDNHYQYTRGEHMVVTKTEPVKLEFVVRGYMTGSTETSIWPMYKDGKRNMYGINFRDGYKKNEQLDEVILTPTTKGDRDIPIDEEEIVAQEYLDEDEMDFIRETCLELFEHGQMVAESKGLILVDTKYEFGRVDGRLILIDEIHTCDSSRYWKAETYEERFEAGEEPEKMDKDCIRDHVRKVCDPYKDEIPEIPEDLIKRVEEVYAEFYELFYYDRPEPDEEHVEIVEEMVKDYFHQWSDELVVILAGSENDKEWCKEIEKCLEKEGVFSVTHYSSAHKETQKVLELLEDYEDQDRRIVYVTVAGMSNALSGVTACNVDAPVIACPPFKDKMDMMVNVNSTLQMPSKVPVMTILSPGNVAVAVSRIFKL
jgi:phosphoribosylaminoimidazole-succinocarboxamide synthase